MADATVGAFFLLLLLWVPCAIASIHYGAQRGAGCLAAFVGIAFGPVGLIITLLLPDTQRARSAICPYCCESIFVDAKICPHCRSRLKESGTGTDNATT